MTIAPPPSSLGKKFWQQVLVVAGLYLLVQGLTLSFTATGWAKYHVQLPLEQSQYWDAGIYAQLAIAPRCTAFYPLWPWLIRVLGSPATPTQALQGATVGSTLVFLGSLPLALLTFAKIIRQPRIAFLAFCLYALGPNAIFHGIGYTESLFSSLSLGLLFTLAVIEDSPQLGRGQTMGLLGLLLALTTLMSLARPMMVPALGAIALVLCLVVTLRVYGKQGGTEPRSPAPLRSARLPWLVGIMGVGSLLGYSLYGGYCWRTAGDFWAPFHAQVDWGRSLALRPQLLLLPRSLLIDLHGLYLPLLLMVAIAWLLWGVYRGSPGLRLVLPRSPWFYALLIHPLVFTAGLVGLHYWGRSHTRLITLPVTPGWSNYLGRFSVLFAIAFSGAHALINLLANSGNLYSTSRHVFGTPFVFVGIGVLLTALNQPVLNRVTWGIGAIGIGLLAQQWVAFATNGWLG